MWPDWILNPGPLTPESGALLIALRIPGIATDRLSLNRTHLTVHILDIVLITVN